MPIVVTLALGAAGCSGDGDGADSATNSTTEVASVESTDSTSDSNPGQGSIAPSGNPSTGCEGADVAATTGTGATVVETTDEAGRDRTYLLALPDDAEPGQPMPLVLALHGALGSAAQFDESTDIVARGTERGFVVVMPDAVEGSWDYGIDGPDDAFLTGLVAAAADSHCIDLDRVHLVGMSLGAWKSAITACANPGTFASLVLVTVEVRPEGCEPLPVLALHGTGDQIAPYGEGGDDVEVVGGLAGLSGSRINAAAWAEGAGCDPTWEESRIEPDVVRWAYQGCDPGMGVELFTIEGGDHAWPGSPTSPLPTTEAIHATDVALDWLEAHSRADFG